MIKKGLIPLLALGHGLNDLLAGYFLGSMARQGPDLLQTGLALFVYNLLAFGGQYPVALWLEKVRNRKQVLAGAFALNVAAAGLFLFVPTVSVVLAGIASAVYHVAGGAVCARENKALNIGLFAAPGVAGLIAGGYFAWHGYQLSLILLPISFLFFLLLLGFKFPEGKKQEEERPVSAAPDRHDIIMILLLTVIALRSAVWNIFQLIYENNFEWLIAIAIAAFAGKIVGGWLADRIGWRLYIYISLISATALIHFFREELLLFCMGIGLLQSGIPASTALLIESVKGKTERGIGLSFGTAIILGAFAFIAPAGFYDQAIFFPAILIAVTALLFFFAARKPVKI